MQLLPYFAVAICALILTVIIEKALIPLLSGKASQPIYKEGPSWHIAKSGTPTMGGIGFIISILLTLLATCIIIKSKGANGNATFSILISLIYAISNSLIGVFDDLTKLKRRDNAGLTPMQKIFFQLILAIIFLMARAHYLNDHGILKFSFGNIDLGFLYYPLAILMLLGIVNCANLTDGIDGLASSVAFAIGIALLYISITKSQDVAFVASSLIGGALGFLFFNIYPAKIFMGDTGSLFLGALTASCAFSLENPLIMILIGGVYVIEGVSVILQVLYFKATGKRLFKMAPLHHHLEKCGFSETKICLIAMLLTLFLSIPAFMLLF